MKNFRFLGISILIIVFSIFCQNAMGTGTDTQVVQPVFGETPPSSYGNQFYFYQSWEWFGNYITSSTSSAFGGGVDDGISFGSLAGGSTSSLTYTINTGAGTAGITENLYLWADWDQSGTWDTDELIFDLDLSVSSDNSTLSDTLSFTVPAYADGSIVGGDIWFNTVVSPDIDRGLLPNNNLSASTTGSFWRGEQEAYKMNVQPVPEPTTIFLMGLGLVGLLGIGIKHKRKKQC